MDVLSRKRYILIIICTADGYDHEYVAENIGDEGTVTVIESLKYNTTLKKLDLKCETNDFFNQGKTTKKIMM